MQEDFVGKASEVDGDVWVEHDGTKIQSISNHYPIYSTRLTGWEFSLRFVAIKLEITQHSRMKKIRVFSIGTEFCGKASFQLAGIVKCG